MIKRLSRAHKSWFVVAIFAVAMCTAILPNGKNTVKAAKITAQCTNATGDANTINTAIAGSSTGDEIIIDGPCLINATIKLIGDRSYRGESRTGTVLRQADNANLNAVLASDSFVNNTSTTGLPISVRQLTIDCNRGNNSAATDGLVLRSWQSTAEDLHVTSCGGSGIRVTNLSANGTALTNTQVNGRIGNNFIENSSNHGIFVEDTGNAVTDWQATDNWIGSSGADGIHIDNAAGWMVERNHLYGVPKNGIYANRLYGTTISDNYIEGFGTTTTVGTWYGIVGKAQGEIASTINGNRIFNFSGEPTVGSTYRYIGISWVNYGNAFASVTGNAIRGSGTTRGTGIYYSKGGTGTTLTVASTGNMVANVNTPISSAGVTVSAGL